jgi:hypothetical protein
MVNGHLFAGREGEGIDKLAMLNANWDEMEALPVLVADRP